MADLVTDLVSLTEDRAGDIRLSHDMAVRIAKEARDLSAGRNVFLNHTAPFVSRLDDPAADDYACLISRREAYAVAAEIEQLRAAVSGRGE